MNEQLIELPDPMESLKQSDIETLKDWLETPSYKVLFNTYKKLRENEVLKKARKGIPATGDLAMYKLGHLEGQLVELEFFSKIPELAKQVFDRRAQKNKTPQQKHNDVEKIRKHIMQDAGYVNPLTGV